MARTRAHLDCGVERPETAKVWCQAVRLSCGVAAPCLACRYHNLVIDHAQLRWEHSKCERARAERQRQREAKSKRRTG